MEKVAQTVVCRVQAMRWEAESVVSVSLCPVSGERLAPVTPGAHLDIHFAHGLMRSYSLTRPTEPGNVYEITVGLSPNSRGGSHHVHSRLRVGEVVDVGVPRNLFALDETATRLVFLAGAIGITPFCFMVARADALGIPWVLHHVVRTRAELPFVDLFDQLDAGRGRVHHYLTRAAGTGRPDLRAILSDLEPGSDLYVCGPAGMIDDAERVAECHPAIRVHVERFSGETPAGAAEGFAVRLARDNRVVVVPVGSTILAALLAAGVNPPHGCMSGLCGACQTTVLGGVPDHHDSVLSDEERESNATMMICCSGARTPELVLDL